MKRFIFLLFALPLLLCGLEAKAQNGDSDATPVIIKNTDPHFGDGSRSTQTNIVAYYYYSQQSLRLAMIPTEDAVIYFVSPDNTLLDTEYVEEGGYEEIVFNVPSTPGTYTLVVRSESFTGEGRFSVE